MEHRALGHITGQDEGVVSRSFAAWCLWALGYPERALKMGTSAIELAREVNHPVALAHALDWMALIHRMRGERELTRERAEEAIALSADLGFPIYQGFGMAHRGWARAGSPSAADGVADVQAGIAELSGTGAIVGTPYFLGVLAETQWKAGGSEDALGCLEAALGFMQLKPHPGLEPEIRRLKGEILMGQDAGSAGEEAEGCFRRALELARSQEARSLELRAATSLAHLWRGQGRHEEAHDLLGPILAWFTEGFDTQDLKNAKALLDELA